MEKTSNNGKKHFFFTIGTKYRCIKTVKMNKTGKTAFKAGKVYEQTNVPTPWMGWLRNEQGEHHAWPQPVHIPNVVAIWDMKAEEADPRNYFEPVNE